ncbi:hypothetical protein EJ06DRAFT_87723 [Trichodelitschia bisporula]|uniref:Uncharacterized protein n=1 Tax=Trichodelitschia bisporula TaxID=703511 RepID=A0A6G1HS11_9PEZI|nr:hypothetical protein EJ06DRAFT_87723 [Trichodelitschia bisporula]
MWPQISTTIFLPRRASAGVCRSIYTLAHPISHHSRRSRLLHPSVETIIWSDESVTACPAKTPPPTSAAGDLGVFNIHICSHRGAKAFYSLKLTAILATSPHRPGPIVRLLLQTPWLGPFFPFSQACYSDE